MPKILNDDPALITLSKKDYKALIRMITEIDRGNEYTDRVRYVESRVNQTNLYEKTKADEAKTIRFERHKKQQAKAREFVKKYKGRTVYLRSQFYGQQNAYRAVIVADYCRYINDDNCYVVVNNAAGERLLLPVELKYICIKLPRNGFVKEFVPFTISNAKKIIHNTFNDIGNKINTFVQQSANLAKAPTPADSK